MENKHQQRTIQSLRDANSGLELTADEILSKREDVVFNSRRRLEEKIIDYKKGIIGAEWLVCAVCGQPVRISGRKDGHRFFKHLKDSNDCPIKTNKNQSKEDIERMRYNGAKESVLHKELKRYIFKYLNADSRFKNVMEEKVIRSIKKPEEWRKPDVSGVFQSKDLAIEIQLSSTFLQTIIEREQFYKQEKRFILWIFDNFTKGGALFTEKDIYYSNNKNAFVITEDSRKESEIRGELVLECQYQVPEIIYGEVRDNWSKQLVTFSQLTFDHSTYRVFFYDYENNRKHKEKEYQDEQKISKRNVLKKEFEKSWIMYREAEEPGEKTRYYEKCTLIACDIFVHENLDGEIILNENGFSSLLDCLYSLKLRKPIKYRYTENEWTQILHNELKHRPQFASAIIKGYKVFCFGETIEISKKYNNIISKIKSDKIIQDKKYKPFLLILFPELEN